MVKLKLQVGYPWYIKHDFLSLKNHCWNAKRFKIVLDDFSFILEIEVIMSMLYSQLETQLKHRYI